MKKAEGFKLIAASIDLIYVQRLRLKWPTKEEEQSEIWPNKGGIGGLAFGSNGLASE